MNNPTSRPRILYLQPSLVPPPKDPLRDRFWLLSDTLEGDIVQAVWWSDPGDVEKHFGPGSYPVLERGNFRYHFLLAGIDSSIPGRLKIFRFFISKTLELHRRNPFACIVAYSHLTTGLVGVALKWLTRTKLVIEIATSPHLVYITERPKPTWKHRLRKLHSDLMLHLTVCASDCVHLLYPQQLDFYPLLRSATTESFHEFVPTSSIERQPPAAESYILQVGAPWYLKGSDLLVDAFRQIQPEFPGLRLKIQGHFPELAQYTPPNGFGPDVEILSAVPNEEILRRIGQARVMVLASRCEGMGRVLIEAMAAGVPVIGADVGGIPSLIEHGVNGLLFPSGDCQALAGCLRRLLADPDLRRRMGDEGYTFAHSRKSEAVYVKGFRAMVDKALQK